MRGCLSFALIGPALAQSVGGTDAAGAQNVIDESAIAIHDIRSNPDFTNLLEKAKGVFIVPYLVNGALVVGGSGGTGVLPRMTTDHIGAIPPS